MLKKKPPKKKHRNAHQLIISSGTGLKVAQFRGKVGVGNTEVGHDTWRDSARLELIGE